MRFSGDACRPCSKGLLGSLIKDPQTTFFGEAFQVELGNVMLQFWVRHKNQSPAISMAGATSARGLRFQASPARGAGFRSRYRPGREETAAGPHPARSGCGDD